MIKISRRIKKPQWGKILQPVSTPEGSVDRDLPPHSILCPLVASNTMKNPQLGGYLHKNSTYDIEHKEEDLL